MNVHESCTSSNYIDSERYHIFPISTLIWLCKISYGHWLSFFKKVIILSFQGVFQTLLGLLHAGLWPSISFGRGRPDGQLVADTCWQTQSSVRWHINVVTYSRKLLFWPISKPLLFSHIWQKRHTCGLKQHIWSMFTIVHTCCYLHFVTHSELSRSRCDFSLRCRGTGNKTHLNIEIAVCRTNYIENFRKTLTSSNLFLNQWQPSTG